MELKKIDTYKNDSMFMMSHDQSAPLRCSEYYNTNAIDTIIKAIYKLKNLD